MTRLAQATHGTRGIAAAMTLLRAQARGVTGKIARRIERHFALAAALAICLSAIVPATVVAQGVATLMADQVRVDNAGRLIASGSVEIWQGSVRMTASRVQFDSRHDQLLVEGPITISDGPDTLLLADAAELSPDLRAGIITSARIVLHQQLQITAANMVRDPSGINQLNTVAASSCPVCASDPTPLWEIRARQVIHDENTNLLQFERAQFLFAGVPVFYLPRLRLPGPGLVRARGVLRPEISFSSDLGLAVGLPYFMPLGEAQDITLTPQVSTDAMASLGFRWRLARANGGIEVGGQISRDRILPGRTRGYGYVRALFAYANGFRLSADLLAASDRPYLLSYGIADTSRLSADITLERVRRDQMIRARALEFYSLRPGDTNNELPNTVVQGEMEQRLDLAQTPLGGSLSVQLGAQAYRRQSSIDGVRGRDVARAHVQLTWRRSGVLAGGILASGALDGRVDHVRVTDDSAYPTPVTRRTMQAMVELRWPWATDGARGARHVIEPVVQAIAGRRSAGALPNDDHLVPELDGGSLFALSRYSGQDAPDDGSRVNVGLRWARFDPAGWSSEVLTGRIWRRAAYSDFAATHVQPLGREVSDWMLAGRLSHPDGYALSLRVLVDPATTTVSRAETNLAWSGPRTDLSTRYLYLPASTFESRTTSVNEWSVDVARRLANGWFSRVGWDYDLSQSLFATAKAGLEFRNECLSLDLSFARRFVTATNPTASTRFSLNVELLGIGGRAPGSGGRTCGA